MKGTLVIIIAVMSLMLIGCGTIVQGTYQQIPISSNPSGARLLIDDSTYTTPAQVRLRRDEVYVATIEKDGFETQQIVITKSLSTLAILNVPFGLVIGLPFDLMTGAAYSLSPDAITVVLKQKKGN